MALPEREAFSPDRSREGRVTDGGAPRGVVGRIDGPTPSERRLGPLHEAASRALDKLVALVVLVVASPLMLVIALAIKMDSNGPVLYRQLRVGKDRRRRTPITDDGDPDRRTGDLGGRPFVLHKFRTMHVDAEADCGPTWSGSDDDRTTRVGRFLRRHRLDELPQLYDVLRGEMSIVGPRPERPGFFQQLRQEIERYRWRQTVRPGITGWAQINRPGDGSVEDVERKLRYDLEYLERRSLWFDLWIMIRTPLVMARPELIEGRREAGRDEKDLPGDSRPDPPPVRSPVAGDGRRSTPRRQPVPVAERRRDEPRARRVGL